MSLASLAAYHEILPELPAREAAVLRVLLAARGTWHHMVKCALTNRQIARELGLDRDSVSPRTARLRQKGLAVEVGTDGKETLYEAVLDPTFVKAPGRRKPKAYARGVQDALNQLGILRGHIEGTPDDPNITQAEAALNCMRFAVSMIQDLIR